MFAGQICCGFVERASLGPDHNFHVGLVAFVGKAILLPQPPQHEQAPAESKTMDFFPSGGGGDFGISEQRGCFPSTTSANLGARQSGQGQWRGDPPRT